MPAFAPGFDQRHPHRPVGAQAIGEKAPGAAGADDDIVELFHLARCPVRSRACLAHVTRGATRRIGLQTPSLELAFRARLDFGQIAEYERNIRAPSVAP